MLNSNIAAVGGEKFFDNEDISEGPQTERVPTNVKPPTIKKSVIHANAPIIKKTQAQPFKLATDKRSQRRNDSKSSIASISSIKTQPATNAVPKNPLIPTQTIELLPKNSKSKQVSVGRQQI
jgi:hypothetical protein